MRANHLQLEHRIPDAPTWDIHKTHAIVACGGTYGCMKCGFICGGMPNGNPRLKAECRNHMPRGSKGRIRKIQKGELMQNMVGWPNGEIDPVPYFWARYDTGA